MESHWTSSAKCGVEAGHSEAAPFLWTPLGSAMPLLWAHAEYIKLCRSLRDGKAYVTSDIAVQRDLEENDNPLSPPGVSATKFKCCLARKISASNCTIRQWSAGRSTPGSEFTISTCRQRISVGPLRSCSHLLGPRLASAKAKILKSVLSNVPGEGYPGIFERIAGFSGLTKDTGAVKSMHRSGAVQGFLKKPIASV